MITPPAGLYKGNDVYFVDAQLLAAGKKTNRVKFNGKVYFWPVIHSEQIAPSRWAIRRSFYHVMFQQEKTKAVIKSKLELQKKRIRRISMN